MEVGEPANLVLVDPEATWTVDGAAAGQSVGQHALRGDDAARRGDSTMLRGKVTARAGKSPA